MAGKRSVVSSAFAYLHACDSTTVAKVGKWAREGAASPPLRAAGGRRVFALCLAIAEGTVRLDAAIAESAKLLRLGKVGDATKWRGLIFER